MTQKTRGIKALETIKHHPYYLDEGDVKPLMPKDVADYFIEKGWAEDLETGEVGERSLNPSTLDIHKSSLTASDNLE